ncbi:SdrD B-like domain-containing protein [Tenacibaculum sp. UWU-22]|uniref:SdrD B-like domain-containing protein n=1 Tax=Tenacibaculum sp. UWU-22 TaxID=3234187 RepID=UPI0034DACE8C
MKTLYIKKQTYNILSLLISFAALSYLLFSCNKDENECINKKYITAGCNPKDSLNLSTGIDTKGDTISPGKGVVDPFWRVINNPPLTSCYNSLKNTINGSAYVINYSNSGDNAWVNQPNSKTLAPVDLGTTDGFGCNNAKNKKGETVPYVFERPFCVLDNTCINYSFTFKADDQVYFELIDLDNNNTVIATSSVYTWASTPIQAWQDSNVCLNAGSYSLRAYLVNTNAVVLGFSLVGNITTTKGDKSISNNTEGCCQNNVISILNILEENCDGAYNGADVLGNGWVFNLKDSTNSIIKTATTDINGNIFFSGLSDGTYTVEIIPHTGWVSSSSASGSITVSVANNMVKIVNFYNCKK